MEQVVQSRPSCQPTLNTLHTLSVFYDNSCSVKKFSEVMAKPSCGTEETETRLVILARKSVTDEMDNYYLHQTYTQIRNSIHSSFNKGRNVWLSLTPLINPHYIKPQAAIYRKPSQTS